MSKNYIDLWREQYKSRNKLLEYSLLAIVVLSFMLSDWMLGIFTFTEYIIGIALTAAVLTGKFRIYLRQIKWLLLLLSTISIHSFILNSLGTELNIRLIIISLIKLLFYFIVVSWIINLINDLNHKYSFLFIVNIAAVVVFILGVYIALSVYLELHTEISLPYERLLMYTRLDGHLFRRDLPIVRMKSIFEEPAHLGYFLNTVLSVNILGPIKVEKSILFNSLLIIGIIMTMSYSAIAIMISIIVIKIFSVLLGKEFNPKMDYKLIIIALVPLLIIFLFRDVLYTTFIVRTLELIDGTETSGYERLFDSWRFVNQSNFILGLGFMQSPGSLWNNYAYMLTELGVLGISILTGFNLFIAKRNAGLGLIFLFMNFAKGGYLSSSYWLLILLILLYSRESNLVTSIRKEEHF